MSGTSRAASLGVTARALRYPLRANPRRFWIITLVLATVIGLIVTATLAQARSVVADLGEREPVVVARNRLEIGRVITSGDLELRQQPVGWIPDGAASNLTEVIGMSVLTEVAANEVVVGARIGDDDAAGRSGLTADERGVAVAIPAGLQVTEGDAIELVTAATGTSSDANEAGTLNVRGRVLTISEAPSASSAGRATVAIDIEFVATIAEATQGGNLVTVVLAPQ